MKRVLIVSLAIVAFSLAVTYLFIPTKSQIKATTTIRAALPGVFRSLAGNDSWRRFWPGETPFRLGNDSYTIKDKLYNVLSIDIHTDNDTIRSIINLVPVKSDLITIEWNAETANGSNPFTRPARYRRSVALEKNLNTIIEAMKQFMEQTKNVYGFDIRKTNVADSVLITTRRKFNHRPTNEDVDNMIQSLKNYIAGNAAIEKNSPMLNVHRVDSLHYEVMTAIPVDRELPLTNEFAPKFLLKGGDILETEVRGGPYTIEVGLIEMENFKNDYRFDSPAIPFQLLITDRLKERDTTKWVTRLYYPVS